MGAQHASELNGDTTNRERDSQGTSLTAIEAKLIVHGRAAARNDDLNAFLGRRDLSDNNPEAHTPEQLRKLTPRMSTGIQLATLDRIGIGLACYVPNPDHDRRSPPIPSPMFSAMSTPMTPRTPPPLPFMAKFAAPTATPGTHMPHHCRGVNRAPGIASIWLCRCGRPAAPLQDNYSPAF